MGAFLLRLHESTTPQQETDREDRRSLAVFEKKGLVLDRKIVRPAFTVHRFRKLLGEKEHVVELQNGDFVLATGTPMYDGMTGKAALTLLYDTFDVDGRIEGRINGQFCIVIYKNGQLSLLTDFARFYPVYASSSRMVFSNSFLAVARAASATLSVHEFYQYVLHGLFVGERTLLRDVRILESRQIHRLGPEFGQINRQPAFRAIPPGLSFDSMIGHVAGELCDYYAMLGSAFGKTIGTALSGGYDSRLQLGLLRRTGSTPVVHVYGGWGTGSLDVKVAKAVAAGEGFALDHVDKSAAPRMRPEEVAASVERSLYFFDGIKPAGLFDDGLELTTRLDRAAKAPLQLNASGGEIYREIWNLGDRSVDLITFLRMRYDRGAYDFCRPPFDTTGYFAELSSIVQRTLGIDRARISRREAEMLFPFMRNWFGAPNNAANNQISYALEPFMEAKFIFPSLDIPIRFKYCGRFEAALIGHIDAALAKYDSQYGINFSDPIPLAYRVSHWANRSVPLPMRLIKRRLNLRKQARPMPYYLQGEHVRQVVDMRHLRISEFIDIDQIGDPALLSRALSVEVLLNAI